MLNKQAIELEVSPTIKQTLPEGAWEKYVDLTIDFLNKKYPNGGKPEGAGGTPTSLDFYEHPSGVGVGVATTWCKQSTIMFVGLQEEVQSFAGTLQRKAGGKVMGFEKERVKDFTSGRHECMVTKSVQDAFGADEINGYIENTLTALGAGEPYLDGMKNVAAVHMYDTSKGKIGTFTNYFKDHPLVIFLGTEKEVMETQETFSEVCENEIGDRPEMGRPQPAFSYGRLSPRERFDARRKLRKKKKDERKRKKR